MWEMITKSFLTQVKKIDDVNVKKNLPDENVFQSFKLRLNNQDS